MRRFMFALSAVLAMAVLAAPVDAQLKFGAQAGLVTGLEEASALDGTFGLGGRVLVDPPLLPVGGFVSATYFFPDNDVSYWTATAAAQLRLPLPMVKPYALAGWQLRGTSFNDQSNTENGPVAGIGVQLDLAISAFLEATFEFNEDDPAFPDVDNDPFVIKGGILFGGS
ncbi:MAG: hypothetical protein R3304_08445 [Longimicrobiales bacterium]|nr:hypothetical protein [Longimicrobiales bacterium]